MPRAARVVVTGVPHHVTQRGNRRENIFRQDADRLKYLELLREYAWKHGMEVLAYCLMTNHVHLVVIPRLETTLSEVLGPVHLRYAQYFNWLYKLSGRLLWQGRYFSCPLDDRHCLAAIRYVDRNPVRAGLAARPEDYDWSSAPGHTGLRQDPLLAADSKYLAAIEDWTKWLAEPDEEDIIKGVRQHTMTGRPLGSRSFVTRIEVSVGRILHALPWGRPRKRQK